MDSPGPNNLNLTPVSAVETLPEDREPDTPPSDGPQVFELPGGYIDPHGVLHDAIILREMTGEEEDLLAAKKTPLSTRITQILANCTMQIGSITRPPEIHTAIAHLPVGDRIASMIFLRRVSLGDKYKFKVNCPHCKAQVPLELDLSTIEIKPMPDKMIREYPTVLSTGAEVVVGVMTGIDEEKLSQIRKGTKDTISLAIMARLRSVNGEKPTLHMLKKMSLKDRNRIRKLFDSVEAGVDTDIEATCTECNRDFKGVLDIGQPDFFYQMEETEEDPS